jgi:hypothetical protein
MHVIIALAQHPQRRQAARLIHSTPHLSRVLISDPTVQCPSARPNLHLCPHSANNSRAFCRGSRVSDLPATPILQRRKISSCADTARAHKRKAWYLPTLSDRHCLIGYAVVIKTRCIREMIRSCASRRASKRLPEATASPLLSLAHAAGLNAGKSRRSLDPLGGRALDSPAMLSLSQSRENPACSRTRLERSRASTRWLGRPTGLNRGSERGVNLLSMNDVGPESLTTPAVEGRSLALPYRSVPGWGLLAEDGRGQPSTSGRAWLSAGGRGWWWVVGERASGCGRRGE